MSHTAGVVVGAGAGLRLGAGTAKGLVELVGEPLVVHSARALAASEAIDELVVVAAVGDKALVGRYLEAAGVAATVCDGGASRAESVACGLAACTAHCSVVAVHDAARPLVTAGLVDRVVAALSQRWAAVAPGLPVADTLKLVDDDGAVARTVDRSGLWGVQTPQVFTRGTLAELHGALADPPGATDDLGLVEHAGGAVRLIEGEATNFKVTYPGDLALAEAVLSVRRAPAG